MIERYFFAGAKFNWSVPAAISNVPQDGTIVNNPATVSAMTFHDLDLTLASSPRDQNRARASGVMRNQAIQHDWLCYILGRTARINSNIDVLTGFMSGCYICVWTDATGARQVGHIGTVDTAPKNAHPNTTVKNTFQAMMPANVIGYSPADAWQATDIAPVLSKYRTPPVWKILSLVTAANMFYSILLIKENPNGTFISSAGIKQCAGLNHAALTTALT